MITLSENEKRRDQMVVTKYQSHKVGSRNNLLVLDHIVHKDDTEIG